MQQLSNCGCISCTCDYGSRALCLSFGFAFRSSPSNRGRGEQSWEIRGCWVLTLQLSICWDETLHPLPSCSKPTAAFWHTLQWGTTIQVFVEHSESLVGRERQGKRAAASQLSLSQTPAQRSRAGLQIKAFQIVVARNSKSSQMKAGNWECLENVALERPPSCISTKRM